MGTQLEREMLLTNPTAQRQCIQDDLKEAGVANRQSLSVLAGSGPASTGFMLI